jgi:hypothetical protein
MTTLGFFLLLQEGTVNSEIIACIYYCDSLIIATRQDKEEKNIDVNFYLNVRFRFHICLSLIPLQATCHVYL